MTYFKKKNIPYSLKNIPIPSEDSYLKALINQTEKAIGRLRWRTIFHLKEIEQTTDPTVAPLDPESDSANEEEDTQPENNYGFKSNATPPPVNELMEIEKDWWKLIDSIKFSEKRSPFQKQLRRDVAGITKLNDLLIPADKTRNLYITKPDVYKRLLHENATKNYRIAEPQTVSKINTKAKAIAVELKIEDRIESLPEKEAFISIKDHKQNFMNKPQCRLINPAKTEIGKISKTILQRINAEIREKTGLKQWRNTQTAVDWFESLENKENLRFAQCDIVDFYPSITKKLLDKAIAFAKGITTVTEQEVRIVNHARETVLFKDGENWRKKRVPVRRQHGCL